MLAASALYQTLAGLTPVVGRADVSTLAAAAAVLGLAASVAALLAARRAAGVDPLVALRRE
jgi:ABC-type lipoprotein release transport system permease subunit